jgi:hypothetical protein
MSEETKHDKFVRIRDARMEKAQKAISLLGNLAAPNYEYSEEEAQGIVDKLCNTVDEVRREFGLPAAVAVAAGPAIQPVIDEDDDAEVAEVAEVAAPAPARAVKSVPGEVIEIDPKTGREPEGLLAGWGFVGKAMEAVEDGDMEKAHELLKTAMAR